MFVTLDVRDPRREPRRRRVGAVVLALGVLAACVAIESAQTRTSKTIRITGSGATFPYPLYSTWFATYAKAHPDVEISYLAIGSGGGIHQVSEQIVFFGATDVPMNEDEYQAAFGRLLHLPTVVGAVAMIYNLPGVSAPVKLDGPTIASIYLGAIRNWNDPAIARLNAEVTLPTTDITVVYRGDSSGTSYVLGDYLAKRSNEWRRLIGANRTLRPPPGIGVSVRGSEGVSAQVRQTPGAIGYVELAYAERDKLAMAHVQNAAGAFVAPSVEGARAAADAAVAVMPKDFRVSITNADGAGVYPISSFTWLLVYQRHGDRAKSQKMVEFMRWALTDGQKLAPSLGYAPLPPAIVTQEMTALGTIRIK